MSLSKEWVLLSRAMYGQEFIDELSDFLHKQKVKTILECGCGDGNILHGLALKNFEGIGIDADKEMIGMAKGYNLHKNIRYKLMDWRNLDQLPDVFDAVICRGNSISIAGWGKEEKFNSERAKQLIAKNIELMLKKVKSGGLFYIDITSQTEIDMGDHEIKIDFPDISLNAKITYDWKNRIRRTYGKGIVHNEPFEGGANSYLITPKELEDLIIGFNIKNVWHPDIKNEKNYYVICARKNLGKLYK